ncbi:MAG TPA: LysR family transcriptional regulator, partial [Rhodospirillum rubrum]|nr:LysR family transcriptional regulator [Rhodospirillum rubrum]
ITMANVAGSDVLELRGPDGQRHRVPVGGRLRVDQGLAAREAFRAGRGFGPTHRWLVDDLVAAGGLEVILPGYTPPAVPLNMLIVPERAAIARVRLLVDFLVERIGQIPGLETS